LYELFKIPDKLYLCPVVRYSKVSCYWYGLRLLKDAGIGGVEINPVEFPSRFDGDDLGKPSLKWLSNEWIDMLKVVFDEARSLGMTCDLIVGSGWPFGAEYLKGEQRAQIIVIAIKSSRP
jgi:hypothetical protein